MQQDRGDTSAQIKDQIEQLIAKMQQIETAGLSLTLDARGYTKTCRDKTIEKLKSISSDDLKEVIKELEIIKTQPKTGGQLNTYKIYRDNKDKNDRSIEFFYSGGQIQLLISYSKQKGEAVEGRRQGGFKSANKKLLISQDIGTALVVELSIRKDLHSEYYKRTKNAQITGLREEIEKTNKVNGLGNFELSRRSISQNKMSEESKIKDRRMMDRTRFIVADLGIDLLDFIVHISGTKDYNDDEKMKDYGLEILNQMKEEVKKLHNNSIASYDLKLDNFLWDEQKKQLTLIDLGLSKKIGEKVSKNAGSYDTDDEKVIVAQTSFSMQNGGVASTADDALGMLYSMDKTAHFMKLHEIQPAIRLSIKLLIAIYAKDLSIQTLEDINQFKENRRGKGLKSLENYQFDNIDNVLRLVNIAQILGLNPENDEQNKLTIDMLYQIYRILLTTEQLRNIPTRLSDQRSERLETIFGIQETMDTGMREILARMISDHTVTSLINDIKKGDTETLNATLSDLGEAVQVIIKTPILLKFAIKRNQVECIQVLIDHGANITELDDSSKNALHYAAYYGHTDVVEKLINLYPKLMDEKDKNQCIPLHYAAHYGHTDVVEKLIERYPELMDERNADEKSALDIAKEAKQQDVVSIIEKLVAAREQHVKHLQHPQHLQNRLNASMKDLEAFGKRKRDNGKKDMEEKDMEEKDMEEKDMERENKKPST